MNKKIQIEAIIVIISNITEIIYQWKIRYAKKKNLTFYFIIIFIFYSNK